MQTYARSAGSTQQSLRYLRRDLTTLRAELPSLDARHKLFRLYSKKQRGDPSRMRNGRPNKHDRKQTFTSADDKVTITPTEATSNYMMSLTLPSKLVRQPT